MISNQQQNKRRNRMCFCAFCDNVEILKGSNKTMCKQCSKNTLTFHDANVYEFQFNNDENLINKSDEELIKELIPYIGTKEYYLGPLTVKKDGTSYWKKCHIFEQKDGKKKKGSIGALYPYKICNGQFKYFLILKNNIFFNKLTTLLNMYVNVQSMKNVKVAFGRHPRDGDGHMTITIKSNNQTVDIEEFCISRHDCDFNKPLSELPQSIFTTKCKRILIPHNARQYRFDFKFNKDQYKIKLVRASEMKEEVEYMLSLTPSQLNVLYVNDGINEFEIRLKFDSGVKVIIPVTVSGRTHGTLVPFTSLEDKSLTKSLEIDENLSKKTGDTSTIVPNHELVSVPFMDVPGTAVNNSSDKLLRYQRKRKDSPNITPQFHPISEDKLDAIDNIHGNLLNTSNDLLINVCPSTDISSESNELALEHHLTPSYDRDNKSMTPSPVKRSKSSLDHSYSEQPVPYSNRTLLKRSSSSMLSNLKKPKPLNFDGLLGEYVKKKKKSPFTCRAVSVNLDDNYVPRLPSDDYDKYKTPSIKSVTHDVMAQFINQTHQMYDKYYILDARFDFEYQGGHIKNAIHIKSKQHIEDLLFVSHKEHTPQRVAIFVYCEFSQDRGPKLWSYIRRRDRHLMGIPDFPKLHYPELYVINGGYCEFFDHHSDLCEPQGYKSMSDPSFASQAAIGMRAYRLQNWDTVDDSTLQLSYSASTLNQRGRKIPFHNTEELNERRYELASDSFLRMMSSVDKLCACEECFKFDHANPHTDINLKEIDYERNETSSNKLRSTINHNNFY